MSDVSQPSPPAQPSGTDSVHIPGSYPPAAPVPPPVVVAAPEFASIGQRAGAELLGALILGVIYGAAFAATLSGARVVGIVLCGCLVAYGVWQWYSLGTTGYSVERRLVGIRVVDESTGAPIGMGRILVRQLVLSAVSALSGGIALIVLAAMMSKDPRRQGWHDKVARSIVVVADGNSASSVVSPAATPAQVPAAQPAPPPSRPADPPSGPATSPLLAEPAGPGPSVIAPPPPSSLISSVPGVLPSPGPPPVDIPDAPPPPPPAPVAEDEIDPRTQAAQRRRAPATWTLTMDDGRSFSIADLTLIGRDPAATGDHPGAVLQAIVDPSKSLSKTHAAFGTDGSGPWVQDCHSTNGVVIVRDGAEVDVTPGVRARLAAGDEVLLGDRTGVVRAG